MRFKLTLAIGFAFGYVLGSKAGRQRYEQIMRTARRVREHPSVQGAAGMLQAQADSAVLALRDRLSSERKPSYAGMNGHQN